MKSIELTQGFYAVVDDADYSELTQYNWHYAQGYAVRTQHRKNAPMIKIAMHRQIMGHPSGEQVDHINKDKLDNRRDNLRVVTRAQNMWNAKRGPGICGLKGVTLHNYSGLYRAKIRCNGVTHHLGYFKDPDQAHAAYRAAEKRLHGKYAESE